jgi:uncharacterized SAM-binding protein YcdF (DUF218 family)
LCGFLVAAAIIASEVPRVTAGSPKIFMAICVIIGAVCGAAGRFRAMAYAAAPVAVLAAVIMLTPLMSPLLRGWVRADPAPTAPLDAVIVLSAGVHIDGTLNAQGAERLIKGIATTRVTRTPMLVTSRVEFEHRGRRIESDAGQRSLVRSLADSIDWRIVGPVGTTRDEAVRADELLRPLGKRRIAVVTSPMHTRRACSTFEAVGFQVVCVPSEEWTYSAGNPDSMTDRMRAFFDYVYERLGTLKYRWQGWLAGG